MQLRTHPHAHTTRMSAKRAPCLRPKSLPHLHFIDVVHLCTHRSYEDALSSSATSSRACRTSWQAVRKVGEVDYLNGTISGSCGSLADRYPAPAHRVLHERVRLFGWESSVIIDRRLPLRTSGPTSTTTSASCTTVAAVVGGSADASAARSHVHEHTGPAARIGSRERAAGGRRGPRASTRRRPGPRLGQAWWTPDHSPLGPHTGGHTPRSTALGHSWVPAVQR